MAKFVVGRYMVVPGWIMLMLRKWFHVRAYTTLDQALEQSLRGKHDQFVLQIEYHTYNS
jgi:hypothetical protein